MLLRRAGRPGEEERVERGVEPRGGVAAAGEDRAPGMANVLLIGEVDRAQHEGRVGNFTRADAEAVLAAQGRAERRQVAGQIAEWVHQRSPA